MMDEKYECPSNSDNMNIYHLLHVIVVLRAFKFNREYNQLIHDNKNVLFLEINVKRNQVKFTIKKF